MAENEKQQRKKRAHETDDEDSDCQVIDKTGTEKAKKQRTVFQTYRRAYTEKYAFILPSSKGEFHVRCTVCNSDFSIKSSGMYTVDRHVRQPNHKDAEEGRKKQTSVVGFFEAQPKQQPSGDLEMQTTRVEAIMCQLIADGNLSLSQADQLTAKMKMFPDSAIAKSEYL